MTRHATVADHEEDAADVNGWEWSSVFPRERTRYPQRMRWVGGGRSIAYLYGWRFGVPSEGV